MFSILKKFNTNYSPLMFLASLGAGGISVTFFMYLMFLTSHETPIPTFDTLKIYFLDSNIFYIALILLAVLGIIFFAFMHFKLLIWNFIELGKFKKTSAFEKLKSSNKEVTLMSIPLTLAMSLNILFILGAVLIPGLWGIVEFMFPLAILGFLLIGLLALKIFSDYFVRLVLKGDYDFVENNNLSQMIAIFAFSMVGVGFAAPAAMSHILITSSVSLIFSIFFITIGIFFAILKIIFGFKSMFEHGISKEASPSFWVVIPFLTLVGISFVRQNHSLAHNFDFTISSSSFFIITTIIISLQLIFGYLGYKIMKANGYFKDYIYGEEKSPGSYALICPGVALVVFGFFFLHLGLVGNQIIDKFSIIYYILLVPLIYLQIITIFTLFKLNKKMFK